MASILDRMSGQPGTPGVPANTPEPEPPEQFEEMTLVEHLDELRRRILYTAVFIALGLVAGLLLARPLIHEIESRANLGRLQVLAPLEGFNTWFKVGLYIAIAIAMPAIIYQIVAFLSPGLTRKERRYLMRALPFVTSLFVAGAAFAFFMVTPRALRFLNTFSDSVFRSDFRAEEVVSFYSTMMLWTGVAFEMPVVIYIISRLGIMSAKRLGSLRKYMVLIIMVIAAAITPTPDPFTMILTAAPMYMLFELGLLIARFTERNRQTE